MTLETVLTDLEKKIFAEADKLRALALEESLKIRQSKLVKELEAIEKELASLLGKVSTSEPAPEPKPDPPKKAPAKKA